MVAVILILSSQGENPIYGLLHGREPAPAHKAPGMGEFTPSRAALTGKPLSLDAAETCFVSGASQSACCSVATGQFCGISLKESQEILLVTVLACRAGARPWESPACFKEVHFKSGLHKSQKFFFPSLWSQDHMHCILLSLLFSWLNFPNSFQHS